MHINLKNLFFIKDNSIESKELKNYSEDLHETLRRYKSDEEKRKSINAFLFAADKIQGNKNILNEASSLKHFISFSYFISFIALSATAYTMFFNLANIQDGLTNGLLLVIASILYFLILSEYGLFMYRKSKTLNSENEKVREEFALIKIDQRIKELSNEDQKNILEYLENNNFKSETYKFTKSLFSEKLNKPL